MEPAELSIVGTVTLSTQWETYSRARATWTARERAAMSAIRELPSISIHKLSPARAYLFNREASNQLFVGASSPAVRSGRCTLLGCARDSLGALARLPRTHGRAQLLSRPCQAIDLRHQRPQLCLPRHVFARRLYKIWRIDSLNRCHCLDGSESSDRESERRIPASRDM
jgi:hypothetical protein